MLWIVLGLIVLVVLFVVATYNSLITLRTRTQEAWSDIDIQLKRRFNLIPNLVNTVKGYATHEKEVFEKITEARANTTKAGSIEQKAAAENALSSTLKTLFAVAENYPDLKANANFLDLQRELADTENKIEYSRRFYNGNVRDLNIKIQVFPANLIAGRFGFKPMEMFEVKEAAEREVPKVQF
ncbi:hypothetical protein A2291_04945 [candidate division WOR-1 bacterium RIFOXYB2_FULL_42_35]|uniref:LemA family protein n=1 Tax=candidate division WOR-1 bacterium RIFOXYC2_FULL_41_25 TaxID=1802586 RepID=A0A1F4TNC7_UNCSA|nr:MAG: hypothetical protein A2247_07145 [candidate division WOR-1 bacterium RIFOXYA2_FULL_41_14]OGC24693.1 MAG: hypothetical protein A2291_04945 [candidate division WOR-1 bacterium RIFOXYB2_FULL_42_35]OGC34208.1 MAG: hypothetical protein A2462_08190 [candidate division WOR-1 bacterium RIFOXYC2_FULL_41_25]OGC41403.1 MAG: hypothetical protein A2548_01000 [candidate division WOR-1 bacterium RIFOXYD2_FULL_41_8]